VVDHGGDELREAHAGTSHGEASMEHRNRPHLNITDKHHRALAAVATTESVIAPCSFQASQALA